MGEKVLHWSLLCTEPLHWRIWLHSKCASHKEQHREFTAHKSSLTANGTFRGGLLRTSSPYHKNKFWTSDFNDTRHRQAKSTTSLTSVRTSVMTATRLVTVIVGVVPTLFDFTFNDGVEVVIARLTALALWADDVIAPGILAMFASLPIFTMPCEPASGRTNDLLAWYTIFNDNSAITAIAQYHTGTHTYTADLHVSIISHFLAGHILTLNQSINQSFFRVVQVI